MALAVTSQEHMGQQVILHGVSWEAYERLLADFVDSHAAHFAYDRGTLEIAVPSLKHETLNRTLATLVEVLADELGLDALNTGSTTLKRADIARGFEPDTSFYMPHAMQVRGKDEIDLGLDPPPDLVIEIDITHPSLDKLPLYAALGIPEVWRYDGQAVCLLILSEGAYVAGEASTVLPGVTGPILHYFVAESHRLSRPEWLRSVRAWVAQRGNRAM